MAAVIHLVGNVGKDAELQESSGGAFLKFSVANNTRKDKTDWYYVSVFGPQIQYLKEKLTKGSKVTVCGRIETYETKEGKTLLQVKAYDVQVVAAPAATHSKIVEEFPF